MPEVKGRIVHHEGHEETRRGRKCSISEACLADHSLEEFFVRFVITYPEPCDGIILEDCKGSIIKRNPHGLRLHSFS